MLVGDTGLGTKVETESAHPGLAGTCPPRRQQLKSHRSAESDNAWLDRQASKSEPAYLVQTRIAVVVRAFVEQILRVKSELVPTPGYPQIDIHPRVDRYQADGRRGRECTVCRRDIPPGGAEPGSPVIEVLQAVVDHRSRRPLRRRWQPRTYEDADRGHCLRGVGIGVGATHRELKRVSRPTRRGDFATFARDVPGIDGIEDAAIRSRERELCRYGLQWHCCR